MRLEKLINTVYSFAAAVVIFGAWAKLEHKDYGSIALTAGLLTEVGIFFIYGLMEWGKSPEEKDQSQQSQPISTEKAEELTTTLKHTNHILNKVFRTE
ncbi:MAG TPA: hypothetical protein VHC96_07260 [Puia sp.]|jgi:hypothetical protein|nr:hypothetical protein [Puia sp.]